LLLALQCFTQTSELTKGVHTVNYAVVAELQSIYLATYASLAYMYTNRPNMYALQYTYVGRNV